MKIYIVQSNFGSKESNSEIPTYCEAFKTMLAARRAIETFSKYPDYSVKFVRRVVPKDVIKSIGKMTAHSPACVAVYEATRKNKKFNFSIKVQKL